MVVIEWNHASFGDVLGIDKKVVMTAVID